MANGTNLKKLSGGSLVTTAALLAIALSQGRTADELDLLALFFTSLADNLALLAAQMDTGDGNPEVIEIAGTV